MTMPKNLTIEQQAEWRKKKVEYVKKWVDANPDKAAKNKQVYYEKNKEDVKIAAAQWKLNNPLKAKQSVLKYQRLHKKELLVKSRENYLKNKESYLGYHKAYREANREVVKLRVRDSQRKNPLRLRLAKYTRRSRVGAGVVTVARIRELMVEQNGVCVYCRTTLDTYHVDHVMPLALGGENTDSNIQLLCPPCNRRKGAKHPDLFKGLYV